MLQKAVRHSSPLNNFPEHQHLGCFLALAPFALMANFPYQWFLGILHQSPQKHFNSPARQRLNRMWRLQSQRHI